ncbi:MAG: hypothetical protein ABSF69_19965, partial [Polyangiaceae bacterium]
AHEETAGKLRDHGNERVPELGHDARIDVAVLVTNAGFGVHAPGSTECAGRFARQVFLGGRLVQRLLETALFSVVGASCAWEELACRPL